MKKFILILVLLPGVLFAQRGSEPFLTKSLKGESIKNAEVETSGGSISVEGVPASEARVEVYVTGNNGRDLSNTEIKERLDEDYTLTVTVSDGKLLAIAKSKSKMWNWKNALNISFKLFVPKDISTDLSTSGGSIHLSHLAGKHRFTTSGGSLHIDDVNGVTNGRTSGGSIELTNSSSQIDLTTSGGGIRASNCSGTITLMTSGGSLHLNNLKGNIRANTSGGSIKGSNIEGELITATSGGSIHLDDLSCSLETATSGGRIEVSMKQLGEYVKIKNSGGNVDLQLPKGKLNLDLSAHHINTGTLENFNGSIEDDEVVGKVNGGGVPIHVRCGGTITLAVR